MTPLILRFEQSPGDVLCGTAALRDLHTSWPGRFLTGVQSPCPDLWEYNPNVMNVHGVEPILMHYPLVHTSNSHRRHFITAYRAFLADHLGIEIMQGPLRPDLHFCGEEQERLPMIEGPYWIVNSGGKNDFTCKQWPVERYQQVVDALPIRFVQVGELSPGHRHEPLRGVTDLRGKTTLRELILLVKHSQGVLCPVTFLMHCAAALERPCVVVAGGREPPWWEAYNGHEFIHNVGHLPCNERLGVPGGCWRSRVAALGDGTYHDDPDRLCADVVNGHPKCMSMITVEQVVEAIRRTSKQ